jgi:geranylgeranyl diphosphate synthase, type II
MHTFRELSAIFEEKLASTQIFPAEPNNLYEPCSYFLALGGKRVRPVLCLMAAELFAGLNDDAWNAAFAIELFHNFTLVHDDIMDNSVLRRGKPTVHAKFGLTAGILSGDVINIMAYQQLSKVTNCLASILLLFNDTAIEVCEGQQLDMDFEKRNDVSMDEYIRMITLKTSVLLACSLKMGGMIAGCLGDNANKLYEFGKYLGIAFQLQDDYLDAFGDETKTGKKVGGDIIENKKTFLHIYSVSHGTDQQVLQIGDLLDADGDAKIEAMQHIFRNTGAATACKEKMLYYQNLAFECLEGIAVPSVRKQHLQDLAVFLLNREM